MTHNPKVEKTKHSDDDVVNRNEEDDCDDYYDVVRKKKAEGVADGKELWQFSAGPFCRFFFFFFQLNCC